LSARSASLGDDASLEANFLALGFATALDNSGMNAVTDIIPSYNSVLIQYDFFRISYAALCRALVEVKESLPPVGDIVAGQLIFFFIVEGNVSDPFNLLELEIALPGETPVRISVPVHAMEVLPDRPRTIYRWPLLISPAILIAGPIIAKVIHEKGEMLPPVPRILQAQRST
jgi:hypothetical protein